jgi:hypothetical protein
MSGVQCQLPSMVRFGDQLKKALIFIHRWMGVAFCLLFLLWFTSGMAMMYWDYPSVSEADRLSRSPVLQVSGIRLSPQEAFARLGETDPAPSRVQIVTFDARPAYRFTLGHTSLIVYADDGRQQLRFPPEMTLRIASAWTGQSPDAATVEENRQEDQWTVSPQFRALRPLRKYSWPDGEQVYVSTVNGDVVQYTTRASRLGAYFGPIPHWLYFTPLRKHGEQWSQLVIWASGLGTIVAILGITVGVWMYSPSRRYLYAGVPSGIPYVGQKRWHLILGLSFGVFACTWAFSGMLSMEPFPRLQEGGSDETDSRLAAALRGAAPRLEAFAAKSPQEAVIQIGFDFQAKEIELSSFAGEPFYLATGVLNRTIIIPLHGKSSAQFSAEEIVEVLRRAARPATLTQVRLVTEYETYYLDRHNRLPLPTIFVQLNDNQRSSYYVDPKTARIVKGYNSSSRRNRWLYHGLHSMNLPWLYKHRPVWDILVLSLMLGGTSLCVTSLILSCRVLDRKVAVRRPNRNGSQSVSARRA